MNKLFKIFLSLFISIILLFAFAVPANPPNGTWQQQFMPFLNNRPMIDITFIDSLTGFAVTGYGMVGDTNYIVKTTNSGNNWNIIHTIYRDLARVEFINQSTGFVCGGFNASCALLLKTTNGGLNWFSLNPPCNLYNDDMHVLNEDTIWLVDGNGFNGGVRRTTNGGMNWQFLASLSSNPRKIYMYNARIGFYSSPFSTFKTTNGGFNWLQIPGEAPFRDMYFIDSLTGWKANASINDTNMRKTTNGGINWFKQQLPYGGLITPSSGVAEFKNINADTIWAVGGAFFYGAGRYRGILYRTTNGGNNWLYQLPDTSFMIPAYHTIDFINKNTGWSYSNYLPQASTNIIYTGIHTTNGGDTTFYIGIQQISNNRPNHFELKQNYPNPFNPRTIIPYKLKNAAFVRLIAYDVTGRETQVMVNQHQHAGEYEVDFIGKFATSSGVYFYRIEVIDDRSKQVYTETKKMILIK